MYAIGIPVRGRQRLEDLRGSLASQLSLHSGNAESVTNSSYKSGMDDSGRKTPKTTHCLDRQTGRIHTHTHRWVCTQNLVSRGWECGPIGRVLAWYKQCAGFHPKHRANQAMYIRSSNTQKAEWGRRMTMSSRSASLAKSRLQCGSLSQNKARERERKKCLLPSL